MIKCSPSTQQVRQVVASQSLHGEKRNFPAGGADFQNADHIRAVERGCHFGFAHEAGHLTRISERAWVQQFDRRSRAVVHADALVDFAHAAPADEIAKAKRADDLLAVAPWPAVRFVP